MFKTIFVGTLFLLPSAVLAEPTIIGNWELRQVAPQAVENTVPRGVTNTKLSFTPEGKLYSLLPDETSMQKASSMDYSFDGKQLKVNDANAAPHAMQVAFPDDQTMFVTQKYEGRRVFKRIPVFTSKLEPRSLQVVVTKNGSGAEAPYDTRDYSQLPLKDRVKGSWEVAAYENVPTRQMPPFGFFNDVWTIDGSTVTIASRMLETVDGVPFSIEGGRMHSSAIALGGPAGSKIAWKVSFDEWGRLVLDSDYCRVVLKLMSKDKIDPSQVPVKVVLLKTK